MTWLWILGVILALLLLVLLTRIGVRVAVHNETISLDVKFGLFSFRVLPAKKKSNKKNEKQAKEKSRTTPEKKVKSVKEKSEIGFADIKDAVKTLWPPLKKALGRTRKGVRIDPLTISLELGAANDPASGAKQYGYLHAGVWTIMPVLEKNLVIPSPSIHVGINFERSKTTVEADVGISARIGTLFGVALTIAIPALRWFLRWQKKRKHSTDRIKETEQQLAA